MSHPSTDERTEPVTDEVRTTGGTVRGRVRKGVLDFRGIPYGAPPVGELRFAPPRPAARWEGVLDATEWGPLCPQPVPAVAAAPHYAALFPAPPAAAARADENCLRLNVTTPALDGAGRPVLVWCHGGAFLQGFASGGRAAPHPLVARGDLVVVSMHHRVGVLGYTYLGHHGADEATGTLGQQDLELALRWVRDNIKAFGGDPDRVTIGGESGGAAKVSTLLAQPGAAGLFSRAFIASGPHLRLQEPEDAVRFAGALLEELDVDGPDQVSALRQLRPGELVAAAGRALGRDPRLATYYASPMAVFGPVRDGVVLPDHPFEPTAAPSAEGIPLLIGSTRDGAATFLVGSPAPLDDPAGVQGMLAGLLGVDAPALVSTYREVLDELSPRDLLIRIASDSVTTRTDRLADRQAATGAPVWRYRFDWSAPRWPAVGAGHGLDTSFWFDTTDEVAAWPASPALPSSPAR
jgi:para-nitrobenzyl esterase